VVREVSSYPSRFESSAGCVPCPGMWYVLLKGGGAGGLFLLTLRANDPARRRKARRYIPHNRQLTRTSAQHPLPKIKQMLSFPSNAHKGRGRITTGGRGGESRTLEEVLALTLSTSSVTRRAGVERKEEEGRTISSLLMERGRKGRRG
jgi:hypothetical protein